MSSVLLVPTRHLSTVSTYPTYMKHEPDISSNKDCDVIQDKGHNPGRHCHDYSSDNPISSFGISTSSHTA
jgi:hypothetical protein